MELDIERFSVALLRDMSDAVIYADAGGAIRFWNDGAMRIFGFTQEEAIGQSLDIIIPENLRGRHWAGFDAAMRAGRSRYGASDLLSVPAMRKDNTRISVEFTVVLFRGPDGAMAGIAAVMRDVTARFTETRMLRRQIQELSGKPGSAD